MERGGNVRSVNLSSLTKEEIGRLVRENVVREARLLTDEAKHYTAVGKEFAGHGTVEHGAGEYVHPDDAPIHTSTV